MPVIVLPAVLASAFLPAVCDRRVCMGGQVAALGAVMRGAA
ncbi:hypothetical protein [Fuscovulum blasticum]|nr:hypothetical protein [Fuscovulum blasticum]